MTLVDVWQPLMDRKSIPLDIIHDTIVLFQSIVSHRISHSTYQHPYCECYRELLHETMRGVVVMVRL